MKTSHFEFLYFHYDCCNKRFLISCDNLVLSLNELLLICCKLLVNSRVVLRE